MLLQSLNLSIRIDWVETYLLIAEKHIDHLRTKLCMRLCACLCVCVCVRVRVQEGYSRALTWVFGFDGHSYDGCGLKVEWYEGGAGR